jgi:phosphatidylglycerophosphate synthase
MDVIGEDAPVARPDRPTIAELRAVAQPDTVVGRVSGEHWAGRLFHRHLSIYVTRMLLPTGLTPNAVTASMFLTGVGAALLLAIPHLWAVALAALVIQVQGILDCTDGELARWRGQSGPVGVYLDRLGHYVTDGCLAVGVGVHADGGLDSIGGWTTIGLATGFLVLLTKAETDLVHSSRAQSGRPPIADTAEVAVPRAGLVRRTRAMARSLPINRALLAMEMTFLAIVAVVVDVARDDLSAMRVLDVGLLAVAGVVVVGHLLAVVSSARLR